MNTMGIRHVKHLKLFQNGMTQKWEMNLYGEVETFNPTSRSMVPVEDREGTFVWSNRWTEKADAMEAISHHFPFLIRVGEVWYHPANTVKIWSENGVTTHSVLGTIFTRVVVDDDKVVYKRIDTISFAMQMVVRRLKGLPIDDTVPVPYIRYTDVNKKWVYYPLALLWASAEERTKYAEEHNEPEHHHRFIEQMRKRVVEALTRFEIAGL